VKIRPIQNVILVRRDPPNDKTEGGIIIPEMAQTKLTRGVVLAAGPGKLAVNGYFVKTELKTGDRIVFGKYSGNEVEHRGEKDQIFMTEDEILGVIEDE